MKTLTRVLSCMGALLGAAVSAAAQDQPRKNVLFVMADDLNTALGAYGHPLVPTPNLDRLAARGVRFDRAYCQYPLCNPSRASLMTGHLPDRTGVKNNELHFRDSMENAVTIGQMFRNAGYMVGRVGKVYHVELRPDVTALPEMFRDAGYNVARVGKIYHCGVPREIGTSGVLDDPASWAEVFNPIGRDKAEEDKIFSLRKGNFGGTLSWLAADGADDEQTDGVGASMGVEWLEANHDQPFFLAVGFYRPHTPFVAPKKYFDRCRAEDIRLPAGRGSDSDAPEAAYMSQLPEQNAMSDDLRREAARAYHAATSFVDAQLGKLLDVLDRLGLWENTIVIMSSDHGYHLGEHGLWQKRSLFEESARIPLVVYAPGMKSTGASTGRLAELIDLYPTLADLCGLKAPEGLPGISLAPLLDDPLAPTKPAAMTQVIRNIPATRRTEGIRFEGYSIRTERWRYTEWDGGAHGVQLYDHENDPQEQKNLAHSPEYQEVVSELKQLLAESRERAK